MAVMSDPICLFCLWDSPLLRSRMKGNLRLAPQYSAAIVVLVMFDMFIIFTVLINNMLSRIEQMLVLLVLVYQ